MAKRYFPSVSMLVDSHVNGQYDDESLWTLIEKAQELDVPRYIHSSFAADNKHYKGDYDDFISMALGAFRWGWNSDTALRILK